MEADCNMIFKQGDSEFSSQMYGLNVVMGSYYKMHV